MKLKSALLAATLATFAVPAIRADEDHPAEEYYWKGEAYTLKMPDTKPVKKRRVQKQIAAPADAGSTNRQALTPPAGAQAKEKRGREGCDEETLSC